MLRSFSFRTVVILLLLHASLAITAVVPNGQNIAATPANEDAVTQAEDTLAHDVYAALIVADPGDVLYSRVGHCAIHLKAPEYDLDYVFSYESEDVRQKVLAFLAGNLKMGMFAIPLEQYLSFYKKDGRGVREYELNLPLDIKRNLWRVFDEHVMEGANLSYDYLARGCAHSTLMMLKEGLYPTPLEYGPWPSQIKDLTRRELVERQLRVAPWSRFFMSILSNGSLTDECSLEDKVIIPEDLVEVLSRAKVHGEPLMASQPAILLPTEFSQKAGWFTPRLVSVILLVLALLTFIPKCPDAFAKTVQYLLLALQFLIGLLTTYLLCFSKLCCTEWSWLIIPYNLLPLICWKWRRYWLLPYAVILLIWAAVMAVWPHILTDETSIVFAVALAVTYLRSLKYRAR